MVDVRCARILQKKNHQAEHGGADTVTVVVHHMVQLAGELLDAVDVCCSSRRRHTRLSCDWSSDVCSSDLSTRLNSRRRHTDYRVTGVQTCALDRKSVVSGKRVDLGGARIIKKNKPVR